MVKAHVSVILRKLKVHRRTLAVIKVGAVLASHRSGVLCRGVSALPILD